MMRPSQAAQKLQFPPGALELVSMRVACHAAGSAFSADRISPSKNHEPPKSGIPKRKKIAMHTGFLAKSITSSGKIMVSDQSLPNSSRATKSWLAF
jgi:hypothetical protein